MQKNAIIAIVVAVIMLAAGIGIGFVIGDNNNKNSDSEPTLVMASACQYPLYEYTASDGDYAGIDIDIVHEAANRMGMKFKVSDMQFNGIISAVQSGKADIGGSAITITDERKESVDFSKAYATAEQFVVTKSDSGITKVADLSGKKIGVQQNTTGDSLAVKTYGQDNVTEYKVTSDVFNALDTGKVDAVIVDNGPAEVYKSSHSGFISFSYGSPTEEYGFIFSKDNKQLSHLFDLVLEDMYNDHTIEKIIDYYNKHNDGTAISYLKTI